MGQVAQLPKPEDGRMSRGNYLQWPKVLHSLYSCCGAAPELSCSIPRTAAHTQAMLRCLCPKKNLGCDSIHVATPQTKGSSRLS